MDQKRSINSIKTTQKSSAVKVFSGLVAILIVLVFVSSSIDDIRWNESFAFRRSKIQSQQSSTPFQHTNTNQTLTEDEPAKPKPTEKVEVIKSKFDKYDYDIFKLENGINVLIASQENVQKIGINIAIKGLGSYQDPQEHQGLSHFVEHLLFTGSKNYTTIDEILLQSLLKNGEINGMTMPNQTMYPFVFNELKDVGFCLKRYVDFLKYPLLDKDEVKNELQSIQSEFDDLKVPSTQLLLFVLKDLALTESRFNSFQCGNQETLSKVAEDPKDIVENFVNTYYSNENTYVTVITDKTLFNETKEMISNELLKLERKEPPTFSFNSSSPFAFDQEHKGKYVKVMSKTDITEFSIFFPLDVQSSEQTKSYSFLEFVFEDMMSISFCSYLTKYHYASDCNSVIEDISPKEYLFGVFMSLTKKGIENQFDISRIFFSYFTTIKAHLDNPKLKELVFTEQAYYFENQQPTDVFSYITALGNSFAYYQNEHLLNHEYNYTNASQEELHYIVDQITPSNAIYLLRKNFTDVEVEDETYFKQSAQTPYDDEREFDDLKLVKLIRFIQSGDGVFENQVKYYDIKYSTYKLTQEEADSLSSKISLEEDIYISQLDESSEQQKENDLKNIIKQLSNNVKQLVLPNNKKQNIMSKSQKQVFQKLTEEINDSPNKPVLIGTKKNVNLWLLENDDLYPGIGFCSLLFSDPSIEQSIVSQLYVELIADYLNLYFDAGLFYPTSKGISVLVFGDKNYLFSTLLRVIETAFNEDNFMSEEQYSYLMERHLSFIYREREEFVLLEVFGWMKSILHVDILSNSKKLELLKSDQISYYDLGSWFIRYAKRFNVEFLVGGDTSKDMALDYLNDFSEYIEFTSIPDYEYKPHGYYDIADESSTYVYRRYQESYDEINYSIVNYYQIGELKTKKAQKAAQIISQFFGAYAFYHLRSISQLGYNIFSQPYSVGHQMEAIIIGIQGNKYIPEVMNLHIEMLIDQVYKELNKLPSSVDFDKILDFRHSRNNKLSSLSEAYYTYWDLIVNNQLRVEERESNEDNKIVKLSKKEVLIKFKKWFRQQSAKVSFQGENKFRSSSISTDVLTQDNTFSFSQEKLYHCEDQLQSKWEQKYYKNPVIRKK